MQNAPVLRERFGQRVREIRRAKGLSLEVLGARAAVDNKHLQQIESARKAATLDTVEKIAAGLGVPVGELFIFTDETATDVRKRVETLFKQVGDDDLRRVARVLEALVGR